MYGDNLLSSDDMQDVTDFLSESCEYEDDTSGIALTPAQRALKRFAVTYYDQLIENYDSLDSYRGVNPEYKPEGVALYTREGNEMLIRDDGRIILKDFAGRRLAVIS